MVYRFFTNLAGCLHPGSAEIPAPDGHLGPVSDIINGNAFGSMSLRHILLLSIPAHLDLDPVTQLRELPSTNFQVETTVVTDRRYHKYYIVR